MTQSGPNSDQRRRLRDVFGRTSGVDPLRSATTVRCTATEKWPAALISYFDSLVAALKTCTKTAPHQSRKAPRQEASHELPSRR